MPPCPPTVPSSLAQARSPRNTLNPVTHMRDDLLSEKGKLSPLTELGTASHLAACFSAMLDTHQFSAALVEALTALDQERRRHLPEDLESI